MALLITMVCNGLVLDLYPRIPWVNMFSREIGRKLSISFSNLVLVVSSDQTPFHQATLSKECVY
jgi:hypothetical protein